jgi:tetratricopeptide (TPR) repeat protein
VELLIDAALAYTRLRQFPAALELYDRALDITPNDLDLMASKACIYQAQGNLQEAAEFLTDVNAQTSSASLLVAKLFHLGLERNHGEAVTLLQTRLAQLHFDSEVNKAAVQVGLALGQRQAGDSAGAIATAEQARNRLERFYRDQPDNASVAQNLSVVYAVLGTKESALKAAERAITVLPRAKDALLGPGCEENLGGVHSDHLRRE